MRLSLVGTGFLALCLATAARADEASAVKAIEKLRGTVTRDDKQPGKPVTEVDLSSTEVTDADLKELKELKQLRELNLGLTKVTDSGLKELKQLKELQLDFTKVTDEGVADLQKALPKCKIER